MSRVAKEVREEADAACETTLEILKTLTKQEDLEEVHFRLWNHSFWPDPIPRAATIVLNRPSALKEMLLAGTEAGLGEAYIHSAFEIEGDFEAAFRFGDSLMAQVKGIAKKVKLGYLLHRLPSASTESAASDLSAHLRGEQHTPERDRDAIQFHYDVSNQFYSLWLDPWMAYSCAYFSHVDEGLATAQVNKFDHICRKLGLKPGDRLLDIGCGWGGLLIHAVKNYGAIGHGITLSTKQADLARERVSEAGLQDHIVIWLQDYRELTATESYDAIVSVGMVEHVGASKLQGYFDQAAKLLKPGGLFMNHGIGLGPMSLPEENGSFIDRYVFPDTDLLPIDQTLRCAEMANLEIRDVESLREHYALTLKHWVANLQRRQEEAHQHVSEATCRVWRLYMAGCSYRFAKGQLSIYQTLLAKLKPDGTSTAPSTRASWYRGSSPDCPISTSWLPRQT
jgi:cyclopropane-fatty-acyl-phospholipid synthase